MTIAELKEKNITELSRIARTLEIQGTSGLRKQDLIFNCNSFEMPPPESAMFT